MSELKEIAGLKFHPLNEMPIKFGWHQIRMLIVIFGTSRLCL